MTLTCLIEWHRVWSGDINVYDQAQCASQCSCIEDLWVSVQCLIKSPRWRYFLQPLLRTRVSVTGRTDLALIIKRWLDFAMHLSVKEFDGFVDTCRLCTCLQNPTVNTQYLHILRTWSVQIISKITIWIVMVFFTFIGPCIVNVFKQNQQDATSHNDIYSNKYHCVTLRLVGFAWINCDGIWCPACRVGHCVVALILHCQLQV